MSLADGDCFQSSVDGGIFRIQVQVESFLRFFGEAQIADGILELVAGRRLGFVFC